MAQKKSARFSALKALYDSNPRVFQEFLNAITQDLGVSPINSSFSCPNCGAALKVHLAAKVNPRKEKTVSLTKGHTAFNDLVIQLASLRRTMVADVHSAFTKLLGAKAKTLSKKEYRAKKEEWLNTQIAKELERKARRSSAA